MYTLAVRRRFIARHFLIGGDWGPENFPNSHDYLLELQLQARELDQHGYLVDIVDVSKQLDEVVGHYSDKMLNDLPEFEGLNPSLEHFSRILATTLDGRLCTDTIRGVKVILWENENAWAAFEVQRPESGAS
ncbi:MAG TPA: 6-carboxytetrahydropterin synthase [Anaerolineales bacterium]